MAQKSRETVLCDVVQWIERFAMLAAEASLDNERGFVILKQINLGSTPSIIPILVLRFAHSVQSGTAHAKPFGNLTDIIVFVGHEILGHG